MYVNVKDRARILNKPFWTSNWESPSYISYSIRLVNVLFLQFSRSELNKHEPQIFYWIYMGFFWTQCISTVVLAAFIAANKNEDGPTFMVKVGHPI